MRFSKHLLAPLLLLFGLPNIASAQFSFYQEIGVIAGPLMLKSDYGERGDFQTNIENSGFGIGLVHYMNWAYTKYRHQDFSTWMREHVKVRSELSYSSSEFQHWGKYVEEGGNDAIQLNSMRGETKLLNIGVGAEVSIFKNIHEFEATDHGFGPFLGLGVQFTRYSPKVYSTLGSLDAPGVLFPKFVGGVTNDSGNAFSVVLNGGTRYKLNVMSDLIFDLRGQYYFSDWVDGLRPPPEKNPGNKYNDWNIWFTVGYIHYLGDDL